MYNLCVVTNDGKIEERSSKVSRECVDMHVIFAHLPNISSFLVQLFSIKSFNPLNPKYYSLLLTASKAFYGVKLHQKLTKMEARHRFAAMSEV